MGGHGGGSHNRSRDDSVDRGGRGWDRGSNTKERPSADQSSTAAAAVRGWEFGAGTRPGYHAGRSLLPPATADGPRLWHERLAAAMAETGIATEAAAGPSGRPSTPQVDEDTLSRAIDRGAELVAAEETAFEAQLARLNPADAKWLTLVRQGGTVRDKLGAAALTAAEGPVANGRSLDSLTIAIGRRTGSRDASLAALELINEVWATSGLLPDRRLVALRDRPLASLALDAKAGAPGAPNRNQRRLLDLVLLLWTHEDALARRHAALVEALRGASLDPVERVRSRALQAAAQLLCAAPQNEGDLLRMVVNKLGDPERKVASRAAHLLQTEVLGKHPGMKLVVTREVEALCHRPGLPDRARYYGAVFLSQMVLDASRPETEGATLARRLVAVHLGLFEALVEGRVGGGAARRRAREKRGGKKDTIRGDKKDWDDKGAATMANNDDAGPGPSSRSAAADIEANNRAARRRLSQTAGEAAEVDARLLGALLAGVNRALPFVPRSEVPDLLDARADPLYRVAHAASLGVAVQALTLLHRALGWAEGSSDPAREAAGSGGHRGQVGRGGRGGYGDDWSGRSGRGGRGGTAGGAGSVPPGSGTGNPRFHRALYGVLSGSSAPGARTHGGPLEASSSGGGRSAGLLLALVFRAARGDPDLGRCGAYVRRLLQAALHAPPAVAAGCLLLTSELCRARPGLWAAASPPAAHASAPDTMMAAVTRDRDVPPIGGADTAAAIAAPDSDSDDVEAPGDAPDSGDEAVGASTPEAGEGAAAALAPPPTENRSAADRAAATPAALRAAAAAAPHPWPASDRPDPTQRDPAHARSGPGAGPFWELALLGRHAHPSVAAMARALLAGAPVSFGGDPLKSFTLAAFLDKWTTKRPRAKAAGAAGTPGAADGPAYAPGAGRGARAGDSGRAAAGDAFAALAEREVAPEDLAFHRFYNTEVVRTRRAAEVAKKMAAEVEGSGSDAEDARMDQFEAEAGWGGGGSEGSSGGDSLAGGGADDDDDVGGRASPRGNSPFGLGEEANAIVSSDSGDGEWEGEAGSSGDDEAVDVDEDNGASDSDGDDDGPLSALPRMIRLTTAGECMDDDEEARAFADEAENTGGGLKDAEALLSSGRGGGFADASAWEGTATDAVAQATADEAADLADMGGTRGGGKKTGRGNKKWREDDAGGNGIGGGGGWPTVYPSEVEVIDVGGKNGKNGGGRGAEAEKKGGTKRSFKATKAAADGDQGGSDKKRSKKGGKDKTGKRGKR